MPTDLQSHTESTLQMLGLKIQIETSVNKLCGPFHGNWTLLVFSVDGKRNLFEGKLFNFLPLTIDLIKQRQNKARKVLWDSCAHFTEVEMLWETRSQQTCPDGEEKTIRDREIRSQDSLGSYKGITQSVSCLFTLPLLQRNRKLHQSWINLSWPIGLVHFAYCLKILSFLSEDHKDILLYFF